MPRNQRSYDHRLRDLVRRTRDVSLATSLGVPRSTAAGWLRTAPPAVVTADALSTREQELQVEVVRLRRRALKLRIVIRLLVSLMRALAVDLGRRRIRDGETKSSLLRAIERAQAALSLRATLRILGLSSARYHAWRRSERARLRALARRENRDQPRATARSS